MHNISQEFRMVISERAKRYGLDTDPIILSIDELKKIETALNEVWSKYNDNLIGIGYVYKFLGYSRYYFFNEDYLLSFINGFIFLEAIINYLWSQHMKNTFDGNDKPVDNERDWVLSIRVDVLHMGKILDQQDRQTIHSLRKKRNGVFHADVNKKNRDIIKDDAEKCIIISLKLLYKTLDIQKEFNFKTIEQKIHEVVNKPVVVRKTES